MTVKPMATEDIEKLMTGFKPTEELDPVFLRAIQEGVSDAEMESLKEAGYVEEADGKWEVSKAGVKHTEVKFPKEAAMLRQRANAEHEKERKEREANAKRRAKEEARHLANCLITQGLLVVRDERYRNTPKGWAEALHWFQFELGQALKDHEVHFNYGNTELRSRCGDFEGVPVSQPWRYHDNVLVLKGGFRNIKKRLINSLTEEERELFGLPPVKLNKSTTDVKAKLLEVLTRFQEGATSDLVTTAKSMKRRC